MRLWWNYLTILYAVKVNHTISISVYRVFFSIYRNKFRKWSFLLREVIKNRSHLASTHTIDGYNGSVKSDTEQVRDSSWNHPWRKLNPAYSDLLHIIQALHTTLYFYHSLPLILPSYYLRFYLYVNHYISAAESWSRKCQNNSLARRKNVKFLCAHGMLCIYQSTFRCCLYGAWPQCLNETFFGLIPLRIPLKCPGDTVG